MGEPLKYQSVQIVPQEHWGGWMEEKLREKASAELLDRYGVALAAHRWDVGTTRMGWDYENGGLIEDPDGDLMEVRLCCWYGQP